MEFIAWPPILKPDQPSIPKPSSCLHQCVQAHQHYCMHSPHQRRSGLCSSSAWWYEKKNNHLEILWQITLSLPQALPAISDAMLHTWYHCRQSLPPWYQLSCLLSLEHCRHCRSHSFYLAGGLELANSSWIPELPSRDAKCEHFCTWGCEWGSHTLLCVVLFDAFLVRDEFYVADCTAETLSIEFVVWLGWMAAKTVCEHPCLSCCTRCYQQRDHWLRRIPELCQLPHYGYWSHAHHGHCWTHRLQS